MQKQLPRCPVETTLSLINNKWQPLIWCAIYYGKKRFSEISKVLGHISTKVLTTNLREMEEKELITRTVFPEIPPRVEYELTELGLSLKPVLYSMVDWGTAYKLKKEGQLPIRSKDGDLLIVTKAEKQDLSKILELQYLCYQSEAKLLDNWDIPPLKQTLEEVENEYDKGIVLKVLDDNDNIIGSVRIRTVDGTAYIGKLIVQPDWQGKGIATKLLKEIERICPCDRYELFTSTKSEKNIHLYENVGFKVYRKETVSPELSMVYLEKRR